MFADLVYETLRKVPKGKVTTYSALARAIGKPRAARAVGNALNKNPYAPEVPCHRVVLSSGKVGKFAHGTKQKMKLLEAEGITIEKGIVPKRFILTRL